MDCVFKKALENEIEHYKKDGDIKSFLQYLHYFDIDKALNGDECGDIINSNLSIDESFDLMDAEHNFQWLLSKLLQRRYEYISLEMDGEDTEEDFLKYMNFINSLDLGELSEDQKKTFYSQMVIGIEHKIEGFYGK